MDKKILKKYQVFSIVFTFILGSLLHFTYKWSGNNSLVAIFSAINESVWEHLKLLFFPMLITLIIGQYYFGKKFTNFLCLRAIGIIAAMSFLVVFFYTYSGIIGKNIAMIDILSFFIAVLLGEYIFYKLINSNYKCNNKISISIIIIFLVCFIIFTYITPDFGIFKNLN